MSKLTDDIYEWDTNRVVQWLREQGMNDCERIFRQQRINGRALLNFQEYDITSLRVSNESKSKLQKCLQRYKLQKKNRFARGDRRSFHSNNNEESSDDDHYQDAGFETDEFDDSEEEGGEYIEPDGGDEPLSGQKSTESNTVPQGLVGRRLQQLRDSMKARGGHPYVQETPPPAPSQNGHMGNTQEYDDDDEENIYDLPPDEVEEDMYEVPSDSSGGAVVVRPQPTSRDKIIRCEEEQCEYVHMRESSDTYDEADQLESCRGGGPGFIATRIEDEHAQYEIGFQEPTQDMYMVPQEEGLSDEMYEMPDPNPATRVESYPPKTPDFPQETYEEPSIEEAKPPKRPPPRAPEITEEFYEVPEEENKQAKPPMRSPPAPETTEDFYEMPDEEHKQDTPPHRAPPPTPSEPEETYEVPGDESAPAVQRFGPRGPTPQAARARGLPQAPSPQQLNSRGTAFQGFQPRNPGPRFMSPPGPDPGTMPPRGPRFSQEQGPRGMLPQGPGPRGMTPQGPSPKGISSQGPGPRGMLPPGHGPRGMAPQGPGPRGMTPQGPGPRGITPQGPSPRGMTPQGPGPKGVTPQGPGPRGMTPQGTGPRGMTPQGTGPRGMTPQVTGPRGMTPQGTGPRGILPPGPRFKGTEPQDPPQKPGPRAGQGLPKNPQGDPSQDIPPKNTAPSQVWPPDASLQSSPRPGVRGHQKGPLPNPTAFPGPSPNKGPKPLPGPGRGFMGRGGELPPKRELPPQQSKGPAPPAKPNSKPNSDDVNRAYPGGGKGRPAPLTSRMGGGPLPAKTTAELLPKREPNRGPEQAMNRDPGRSPHLGSRGVMPPPEVEAPPPLPGPKPSQAKSERRPLPSPTAPSPTLPHFSTPPKLPVQKESRNRPPLTQRNEAPPPKPNTRESRSNSRDSTFSGSGDDPPLIPLNILKKDSSGRTKNRLSGVPLPPEPQEKTPEEKLKEAHWYHGDLDKVLAADCLRNCGQEGAFIVRNSTRTKGEFAMSLLCKGKVSHLRIPRKDGKFILGDHGTDKFDSILDLVCFYRTHQVELKSGGSTLLTVAAQVFR